MATHKNALARYTIIDQMLSDRHRSYTTGEMLDKVNEMLCASKPDNGIGFTTRERKGRKDRNNEDDMKAQRKNGLRVIQMDLKALQGEPFNLDIINETIDGRRVWKYEDPTRTLFAKQISPDEKKLLREVLNTLGQFSGLDNFKWLDDLQSKLNDNRSFGGDGITDVNSNDRKVIQFSSNEDLKGKEHLGWLFSAITEQRVIRITYRKFVSSEEMTDNAPIEFTVYPYLLKQYNDRWYLFATPVNGRDGTYDPDCIFNFPLDRIEGLSYDDSMPYIECQVDLDERFEEIVGVSYDESKRPEEIILAVSRKRYPYLETKPINPYQKYLPSEKQAEFHNRYPELNDFVFISIEVIPNRELVQLILSFGSDMVVLHENLRNEICDILKKEIDYYHIGE